MASDRSVINAIVEYRENLGELASSWPEMEFDRVAYSRWAADEIIINILSHTDWTPMQATEDFRGRVEKHMCVVTNFSEANFIFDIAYDVACDIIDILIAME
jgi:hypothetical protein